MERLFGRDARDRIADDCSLRAEILDAGRERDRSIAALVADLQSCGRERLRAARDRAAARLGTLGSGSRDNFADLIVPHRTIERAAVLRRFVAMADTANALDAGPAGESSRARVLEAFRAWIDTEPDESVADAAGSRAR